VEKRSPLLDRKDALLIIIDMQERLVPVMSEKEKLVENILKLIRFSKIIGIPVLATEQENLGDTIAEIRHLLPDMEPIRKWEFNAFLCGRFKEKLGKTGRNSLILTGIEAHICVAQTALWALSSHIVHAVGDAVSSRSLLDWDISLRRMQQCGVTMTSTEMVIFELLERAGNDTFRETLKLIKQADK
jgi:isochorismate hydrolase